MTPRSLIAVFAIVVGVSSLTLCHPPTPTVAEDEVPPYMTVPAVDATAKVIVADFDRREQAIQAHDPNGLPALYSKCCN